jgi:hypothetical protein
MSTIPDPATTDWIPMGPPLSINPDLTYKGNWASSTTYFEGDIVIYANMAYLCVKQSTSAPAPWSGAQMFPLLTSAQMTALVPYDGQIIRLQVDATNGIEWTLAYRAASASTYKWEFIGGPPMYSTTSTSSDSTTTTSTWLNLSNSPAITTPRAGDYLTKFGAETTHSVAAGVTSCGVAAGDTVPQEPWASMYAPASNYYQMVASSTFMTGIAAGTSMKMRYINSNAGTATWLRRWMDLVPVRVS